VEGRRLGEAQTLKRPRYDSTRMVTASSPLPRDRLVSRSQDHLAMAPMAVASEYDAGGPVPGCGTGPPEPCGYYELTLRQCAMTGIDTSPTSSPTPPVGAATAVRPAFTSTKVMIAEMTRMPTATQIAAT
jgi:hypothetical protein